MNNHNHNAAEIRGPKKNLCLKIFGIGGAGTNAVREMMALEFPGVQFVMIHTDVPPLEKSGEAESLHLGAQRTRGLGIGGDPELGRLVAEEDAVRIRALCKGTDLMSIVTGLGGGTGTGVAPVVARLAKEEGVQVLAFVVLPFECEGVRRQRQAQAGLRQLKDIADGVISLSNEKALKLSDRSANPVETLNTTNRLLGQMVQSILQFLTRPGFINISFADLCGVVQGMQADTVFATAEATGESRSTEIMEKLFAHPLLENGQALNRADSLLVSFIGGNSLTMAEISRIMEKISTQCEKANVIMGAAMDESFGERLTVTIIASQRKDLAVGPFAPGLAGSEMGGVGHGSSLSLVENGTQFSGDAAVRLPSRFVAPPPNLSQEKTRELLRAQKYAPSRQNKNAGKMRQEVLPLEIVSKGRFDKSEPTIYQGEDLDVPTYIRRGLALN